MTCLTTEALSKEVVSQSSWTSLNSRGDGVRECSVVHVTEKQELGEGTSEVTMGGTGKDSGAAEMNKNNV